MGYCARARRLSGEAGGEVAHRGIVSVNECSFFLATSALDLLFTTDGVANVGKGLEADQTVDIIIFCSEATHGFLAVLLHALFEVVGYAGVENAGSAPEDVDVIDRHSLQSGRGSLKTLGRRSLLWVCHPDRKAADFAA